MKDMTADHDRRSMLRLSGQLTATLAMLLTASASGLMAGCAPTSAGSASDESFLAALADTMLPATQSAGAGTPGNVAFMLRAMYAGLMGIPGDILARLRAEIDTHTSAAFADLTEDARLTRLKTLDAQVFASAKPAQHPWFTVKALILMAHYTSEAGMTQDLHYDVMPGDYLPDVPVDAGWRAPSNDWAAVSVKKALHS